MGTTIGMSNIKDRRLNELRLSCHPGLYVGQCVPFYFCPRSVMLYLIYKRNEELTYKDGQESIVHLEADFTDTVAWATANNKKWAFTLSNAGTRYFEDRSDMRNLKEINWTAVQAQQWSGSGVSQSVKIDKQAEFLIEHTFPWHLVERIGVHSQEIAQRANTAMNAAKHWPKIETRSKWYY